MLMSNGLTCFCGLSIWRMFRYCILCAPLFEEAGQIGDRPSITASRTRIVYYRFSGRRASVPPENAIRHRGTGESSAASSTNVIGSVDHLLSSENLERA